MNYYNENDPKAAAWLRELIKEGHISEGVVDERSIVDVQPADLVGYYQCHFFAGIGGWSYALRLAGVPDDEPVWSGSCPCQPFSNAGKQLGTADERHLWPIFFNLIRQWSPATVFGEQVASKAGRTWLAGVFADLESVAYATAGADLCAAGVRAPHIRQRLWWVADSLGQRRIRQHSLLREGERRGREEALSKATRCSSARGMGDTTLPPRTRFGPQCQQLHGSTTWSPASYLHCTDGKTRRIEPCTFPLAHGVSGRVGLLRGYGNAIVPQVAAEFIQTFYEARHDVRSDVLMNDPMF